MRVLTYYRSTRTDRYASSALIEVPQLSMRPDEEFVARCLVRFLGGPSAISVADGEDPPDFYLSLADNRIGVEVTQAVAPLAQLAEQVTLNHWVAGSSPARCTP